MLYLKNMLIIPPVSREKPKQLADLDQSSFPGERKSKSARKRTVVWVH